MSLERVRIVLVGPTHAGNIGGVARAMKNMCLGRLTLVAPAGVPGSEASARAAGADDVLVRAQTFQSLDEALAGCRLVIGTSARSRAITWPILSPREAADRLVAVAHDADVALVFGPERTGLSNAELDRCQFVVAIPANEAFSSLNLACAVQIMAYELYQATQHAPVGVEGARDADQATLASSDDLQRLYQHLEEVLIEIGFLDPSHPRKLMRRLMRLFNRAELDGNELNILRGILTAVQKDRPRDV